MSCAKPTTYTRDTVVSVVNSGETPLVRGDSNRVGIAFSLSTPGSSLTIGVADGNGFKTTVFKTNPNPSFHIDKDGDKVQRGWSAYGTGASYTVYVTETLCKPC